MKGDPVERFQQYAGPLGDGCQEWSGEVSNRGYGLFWNGVKKVSAHRWAYEQFVAPIPEGYVVMHLCDNPPCVRPDHLKAGTYSENNRDRYAKGRAIASRCGSAASVDVERVRAIRRRAASGETYRSIAADYGLSHRYVGQIVRYERCAWVDPQAADHRARAAA